MLYKLLYTEMQVALHADYRLASVYNRNEITPCKAAQCCKGMDLIGQQVKDGHMASLLEHIM